MKHIFVLVSVSAVLLLAFIQCDTFRSSTSSKEQRLPKKVLKALRTADSIIAYRIDAMNEAGDSTETLCGFAVKGASLPLKKESAVDLQALVDSFFSRPSLGKVKKFSTFIPDVGFKFCSSKDCFILLLDLHADLCTFYHKKKQYLIDTDSINSQLSLILNSIFREVQSNNAENELVQKNNLSPMIGRDGVANSSEEDKYVKLNSTILQMITEAKEMTCYIIDPLIQSDQNSDKLDKYVILQKQKLDNAEWMKQFRQTITGKESFEKFDFVKNCTFLPDIVFQLHDKGRTLDVLFSFYCSECEMRMNGKRMFRNDCSIIQSRIIQIARQIFPNDKYLRTIK